MKPVFFEQHDGGIFLMLDLNFDIENVGHVTAHNWRPNVIELTSPDGRIDDVYFSNFPITKGRSVGIAMDRAILPGCSFTETKTVGFQLRPTAPTRKALRDDIEALLREIIISYRLATENSPGESTPIRLASVLYADAFVASAYAQCPSFFQS
jgi:hypothetical protein